MNKSIDEKIIDYMNKYESEYWIASMAVALNSVTPSFEEWKRDRGNNNE